MRILVVSDTHGSLRVLEEILEQIEEPDMLIHCGDVEGQEEEIRDMLGMVPCAIVAGNNDWFSQSPREMEFPVDDYRFMVTHGHQYGISVGVNGLLDEAMSRKIDVVLFGHTHRPVCEKKNRILYMNPGSLTYPRQIGRKPTYGIIEIDKNHEIYAEVIEFE